MLTSFSSNNSKKDIFSWNYKFKRTYSQQARCLFWERSIWNILMIWQNIKT